jgi:hypothetical protein
MSVINFSRLMKQSLLVGILVMAAVFGIIFSLGAAKTEDLTSSEAAIAEMKEMFGKIPPRMQNFPKSATAAGWALIKIRI